MKRIALTLFLVLFLGPLARTGPQERAGVWLDVPYVKQTEDGCGSAAISMVLQYWIAHGAAIDSQRADAVTIQKQLYSRQLRGIHASDMESYLKQSHFRVFSLNGTWKNNGGRIAIGCCWLSTKRLRDLFFDRSIGAGFARVRPGSRHRSSSASRCTKRIRRRPLGRSREIGARSGGPIPGF